jgi:hypothetical protein
MEMARVVEAACRLSVVVNAKSGITSASIFKVTARAWTAERGGIFMIMDGVNQTD